MNTTKLLVPHRKTTMTVDEKHIPDSVIDMALHKKLSERLTEISRIGIFPGHDNTDHIILGYIYFELIGQIKKIEDKFEESGTNTPRFEEIFTNQVISPAHFVALFFRINNYYFDLEGGYRTMKLFPCNACPKIRKMYQTTRLLNLINWIASQIDERKRDETFGQHYDRIRKGYYGQVENITKIFTERATDDYQDKTPLVGLQEFQAGINIEYRAKL